MRVVGDDPAHRGEPTVLDVRKELVEPYYASELSIFLYRVEPRQRIPNALHGRELRDGRTVERAILAVRLGAFGEIVFPAYPRLVEQPGEIGPGEVAMAARSAAKQVDVAHAAHRIGSGARS